MKIVHIVPGSGGSFYCENCLRDSAVVRALSQRGHDIVMVPLYLPLQSAPGLQDGAAPIFFGGVNTYLQEHLPLFRHTPRWVDRVFDTAPVLRLAASRAGSTRARDLGPMTLSMLRGEEGHQAKELRRLVDWLAAEVRPDVVHLSNALLLGLAGSVRAHTGAVVVCSLQDEAPWIDAMESPWSERVWAAIRGLSAHVDAFISVSEHYAGVVLGRTGIARERVSVVPIGVDPADYPAASPDPASPVIGYMARMSEAGGLGDLVEAFVRLKRQPGRAALRLAVTGGLTHDDDGFLAHVREMLAREGVARDVEFIDDFGFERRRRFLQSLTLFSVPGTAQTAFGLFVLEALASGVPAVQPAAGAFPEMLGATGGGVLYDPGDPGALTGALASLLDDPARGRELGRRAREGVARNYAVDAMAGRYLDLYRAARGARGG